MRIGRAETTKRSAPRLLLALVVASLMLTTVYFREGEGGVLHSARRVALVGTAPASKVGMVLTSPLRALGRGVSGLGASKREVEQLRREKQTLLATVADLEEARQQNERLQALVGFAQRNDLQGVGASIIGKSPDSWESTILIDRGSRDGVRDGMPVLADRGLLGQVVEVSSGTARVRLVTDQRGGVAALVQRTRAVGVVRGSIEGALSLDFLDTAHTPKVGDVVITSGMGGVYPKGIVIGDVAEVDRERGELFPHVTVVSRVDATKVEEVIVLTGRTGGDE